MRITGAIAHNFHEGSRSEYLAQYVFSAFGTCVPVPHQEDSGIDFHCTLGDKIGQRLHVRNYYSVQVKSSDTPWIFENKKEIEWIVNHNYPMLYCVVNKKENNIKIYQTLLLALCSYRTSYLKRIRLIPEPTDSPFNFQMIESKVDIKLGDPIVEMGINELFKEEPRINFKAVLKSWLDLDQMNINNKILGFSSINVPIEYETNSILEPAKRWEGDLFFEKFDVEKIEKANESFYMLFSQLINQAIFEKDVEKYEKYSDFVGELVHHTKVRSTWGIMLLGSAINNGAEIFGLHSRKLILRDDEGKIIDTKPKENLSDIYKSKMA